MTGALYHYTCRHTWEALGEAGDLQPAVHLAQGLSDWWPSWFIWATDLRVPDREALGLTMSLTKCDRTAYRYRVTTPEAMEPWTTAKVRNGLRGAAALLEVPGARPRHWWVATEPLAVVWDPR